MPEYLLVKEASQREDTVRLCILGEFRLWIAGQDLSLPVSRSSKLKNILCYLIFHRERPVSHDERIATFFENENQRDPVSALKMQIMRIRQLLAPYLSADLQPILGQRGSYQWNPKISCWLDAQAFEALCRQAGQDGLTVQQRCRLYQETLALYDGIAAGKPGQERDLDIVMDGMRETASVRTAFFCGFDQFRIMLPEANMEDSQQVMERLARVYSQRYPAETISLSCQIRGLELL